MTLSIYYCTVIRVPNADEFLKGQGSPELENQFSKKIFDSHNKI